MAALSADESKVYEMDTRYDEVILEAFEVSLSDVDGLSTCINDSPSNPVYRAGAEASWRRVQSRKATHS